MWQQIKWSVANGIVYFGIGFLLGVTMDGSATAGVNGIAGAAVGFVAGIPFGRGGKSGKGSASDKTVAGKIGKVADTAARSATEGNSAAQSAIDRSASSIDAGAKRIEDSQATVARLASTDSDLTKLGEGLIAIGEDQRNGTESKSGG